MLSRTLADRLLGSALTEKGVIRVGEDTIRPGEDTLRSG